MATWKLTNYLDPVQSAGPRVWGYARVNSEADSRNSLDEQRRKIDGRCAENGWRLERIYVDAGVSGSRPLVQRQEGAKLLLAVRPGDIVVAAKMDRMFRCAFDAWPVDLPLASLRRRSRIRKAHRYSRWSLEQWLYDK
ncbi:MAG: recombinase family protein [Alphaproteobacteria bacterium]|nr:recombinase family protein [Alphaproteobacteria bacterium]